MTGLSPEVAIIAAEQGVSYGRRIRTRRKANGIKLTELAEEMGLAASTLSEYERDKYAMPEATYWSAHEQIARILKRRREADERLVKGVG